MFCPFKSHEFRISVADRINNKWSRIIKLTDFAARHMTLAEAKQFSHEQDIGMRVDCVYI